MSGNYIGIPAPPSNPVTDLQDKLRTDQDDRDQLAIRSRALVDELGAVRDRLRDLDLSIRATRGLLNLADAAQRQATDTTKPPAKKTTSKKAAAS